MKATLKNWIEKLAIAVGTKAPTADDVINIFSKTIDVLDQVALVAEGTVEVIEQQTKTLEKQKDVALSEINKARNYAKNIKRMLEGDDEG